MNVNRRTAIITFAIVLIVVIGVLSYYYFILDRDSNIPAYQPGLLEVHFNENITIENATVIIQSYNCTIDTTFHGNNQFFFFINVPEGQEQQYLDIFQNDTAVYSAYLIENVG